MRVSGKISGMTHNTYKNYPATTKFEMRVSGKIEYNFIYFVFPYPASQIPHLDFHNQEPGNCRMRVLGKIRGMTHNTYKNSPESRNHKIRDAGCTIEILANNKFQAPATRIVGCGMK